MAKKKNGILEEQRRAREEFLKLKKMQWGEVVEEKKSYYKPQTMAQKADNFWYHNKWIVLGFAAVIIVLAVMITQCVNKKEYDLQIVYFSYTATLDTQTDKMADYFSEYVTDINGDGSADVQVINCSLDQATNERSYRDSILQKVQANVIGNNKALLFITDAKSIKYFDLIESKVPLFDGEPYALSQDFYDKVKVEDLPKLPDGLQISIRNVTGTMLELESETEEYLKESKKLLENVISAQKGK